jgi:peptidoglycan hydrolase-like protein with peptidoglycan-binding domain
VRFNEFKITEAPDDGTRAGQEPNRPTDNISSSLKAGPPYPPEDTDAVKKMQTKLEELGYSVGTTGVDGKYGPRTTRAIRAYKIDHNVRGSALELTAQELEDLHNATPVENPTPTGNRVEITRSGNKERTGSSIDIGSSDPDVEIPGYPEDLSRGDIENMIETEAELRGIDPAIAIRIFRSEGGTSYQSTVTTGSQRMSGGREASYGPYQLYIGGGLGNVYQKETGRDLTKDNTEEGILNQIRF